MKKNLIALLVIVQVSLLMAPSKMNAQTMETEFSRAQGYFVRPELYGAVLGEFGYQINPNFQIALGGGVELTEGYAIPELVVGARAYASDSKWTAFVDYHLGLLLLGDVALPDHRLSVGPSYKNFDFGVGIMYMNVDGVGVWAPCLNIGFNFRFHKKQ